MGDEGIRTVGPHLVVRDSTGSRLVSLSPGRVPLSIGRGELSDLQVLEESVSRQHARIVFGESGFCLEDVGSRHGTLINGAWLEGSRPLRHNDRINLGKSQENLLVYREHIGGTDATPPLEITATRENIADFRALLEITTALNSSLRLHDVLSKVLDAVVALTGAEHAELLLGKAVGELEVEMAHGPCDLPDADESFSRTVVERVLETGRPEIITNLDELEMLPLPKSLDRPRLGSVICVPFRFTHLARAFSGAVSETDDSGSGLISGASSGRAGAATSPVGGVVYVERSSPMPTFTTQDLALLESFAASAAVAIQNAQRCEELLQKRALEDEIRVAERIQARLLQQEFPTTPWLQVHARNDASRHVGGDYYQFVEHESGEVTFAIGDVSGKGIPAALLMSTVQSTFLMANIDEGDLAEVCSVINRNLHRRTDPWHFVTFFAGRLTEDRNLVYVNAGHNPPLLIRSGDFETLAGGGLPLGLFPDSEYEFQERTLEPGDLIVCYTDGVTEATDSTEEEFGVERLLEVAAAHADADLADMTAGVFRAVADYSSDAPQADDITVALVRIS